MKKIILPGYLLIFSLLMILSLKMDAQCPVGYTRDTLNWDYMEFLPNTGSYVTPTAYITLAQSQTQRFAFGTQKVTVTHNYSGANDIGTNSNNTGETGAFSPGDDVQFKGNGAITFTFQNAVQNIKFSIFDIDRSQRVVISSTANVTLATLTGTILTITNNNTTAARVDAANSNVANTSVAGTVNVSITGPVTSFTITVTNTGTASGEDGSFYLGDVSACYSGTFANNYYIISKPYTGQPAYVLTVRNDSVYYVNVANGAARFLFADYGNSNINSMAYDPYRHMVYYTYSLSGPGGTVSATDYVLRRYDYDKDTLGIISTDVRNLGIPLFDQSVESGAAAFYDGSLYLGIEGGNTTSDRKSMIWKIDFNASYAPQPQAVQVYGTQSDIHDWADFGINNGILYDFDGSSGAEDFYNINMATGNGIHYNNTPSTLIPRQTGVDWNGNVYNIGSPSVIAAGTIVPYNLNGTVNNAQLYNISANGGNPVGSWGDAAEAFKPKIDFGDAPASYDPAGVDPGMHERNDSIFIGPTKPSIEWVKKTSVDATGDGAEEDGVTGLQLINRGLSNFVVPVKVYNHTGRPATLYGWVDANGDGVFQTSEGTTLAVPSNVAIQSLNISWIGIFCSLPTYSKTFMRLRLATNDCGLSTATPNGYADNGEIEDYQIEVTIVLPDQKILLNAQKLGSKNVNLTWDVNEENGIDKYELQRSSNGNDWKTITTNTTAGGALSAKYSFIDTDPTAPVSYYRVKVFKNTGAISYSEIKRINLDNESSISINPNPVHSIAKLNVQSGYSGIAQVSILDYMGRVVSHKTVKLSMGSNNVDLEEAQRFSAGIYKVKVQTDSQLLITTFIKTE